MLESHHDPQSELGRRMGNMGMDTTTDRGGSVSLSAAAQQQPLPLIDYRQEDHSKAPYQIKADEMVTVPHNEYPTDGMTMFCRNDHAPSERSSAASPMRPSSRDSQSEVSNPTSLSSQEQPGGHNSPTKQMIPIESPLKQVQKKRSGFFSNSPFRRKSKHEKEGPSMTTPTSRANHASAGSRNVDVRNQSPRRRNEGDRYSGSPEPIDPRAQFQLNVGPNVFDVASPDSNRGAQSSPRKMGSPSKEPVDPIAAALAELKGIDKQSSVRMSADRYAGVATPAPASTSSFSNSDPATAHRPTPPPSYASDQRVQRLDAPQPAFTSSAMRKTTQKYVGQNQDMYGTGARSGTRNHDAAMPRATSPRPMRATSPRPEYQRSVSPNPYNDSSRAGQTPNASPNKTGYKHNSPNDVGRSPPGGYGRQDRPASSAGMAVQVAEPGRGSGGHSGGRPQSYYGGGGAAPQQHQRRPDSRARSKSMSNGKQYTQDGRPIIQFGKSNSPLVQALSLAKDFSCGE